MEQDEEVGIIGNDLNLPKKKKEDKLLKYILITISVIIIFLILYIILLQYKNNDNENIYNDDDNDNKVILNNLNNIEETKEKEKSRDILKKIKDFEKSLRIIETKEILEFRQLNSLNILFDRDKYKKSENPDITVVLTMHNQAHCIHKALRSIQNQSL